MVTEQQLATYLTGDLRDAELTIFEDEILMDDSSRAELLAQRRVSAGLHALLDNNHEKLAQAILTTTRGLSNETLAHRITTHRPKVRQPRVGHPQVQQRAKPNRSWWHPLAAAAAVAMVLAGAWKFSKSQTASPASIAVLARAADAVWADASFAPQPGSVLKAGWLRLKAGTVQLEFSRGAHVVIEGPAEFQLVSDNEGRLDFGKLWARVPLSAHGFTVRGRDFTAIDLGTEFGCKALSHSPTEVHVFDGAVDVNTRQVRGNQALRLEAVVCDIPAQRSAFIGEDQISPSTSFLRGSRTELDIGSPGKRGSTSLDTRTGVWSVAGGGADIAGASDQFHFVSQEFTGDRTFVAQVTAVERTNPYSKAGLMIRDSMQPDAPYAMVFVGPETVGFEFRTATGRSQSWDGYVPGPGPGESKWVKLVRTGDRIVALHSSDGVRWTQLGKAQTLPISASARAGLAVTAHDNSALNHSTFDHVSAQP